MGEPTAERTWTTLSSRERRVVGVLVEKQKTTPDSYPMSLNAIVTGCNQKSNRDPLTSYDADVVEETLHDLRRKGAVVLTEGSGRVEKWKHTLYEWLDLKNRPAEMAVVAELLLRGPQTEGELRGRASRMDPIPDLERLQAILQFLEARGLVVYLTPPGQRRGVVVTHGFYPPEELEQVRHQHQHAPVRAADSDNVQGRPLERGSAAIELLRAEMLELRERVDSLAAELHELRESLGDG